MNDWNWVDINPEKGLVPPSSEPSKFSKQISNIKRDVRDYTRTASRIGEAVVGTPGNLLNLGLGAANYLTSGTIPTYESVQKSLPFSLPTSSQAKEFTSKLTGGYTDPQSSGEELWDNIVSDVTSLLVPGTAKNPASLLKLGNLALAGAQGLAGNLAGKLAENWGFGKSGQAAANIGTTLLTGIAGGKTALFKQMNNAFSQAEKIAEGKIAQAGDLGMKVHKAGSQILSRDFPGKKFMSERLEGIDRWLKPGAKEVPLPRIMEAIKDLNAFYPEAEKLGSTRELHAITQPLRDFLDHYSNSPTAPKDFGKYYNQSRDIWKGFNTSSQIGKFLNKHVKLDSPILKNPLTKGLLFFSPWFHQAPKIAAGIAGAVAAKEGVKLIDLLANSKTAAKAFADIGLGALNNSAWQVDKGLIDFDKAVTRSGLLPDGARWED